MDNAARFWAKVDKSGDCWLWTAGIGARGYGVFWLDGRSVSAHRLAYEWESGPIPIGHELDHTCGTKICVRPMHLEAVTGRVNTMRAAHAPAAINAAKTVCVRGHPLVGPDADLYPYQGVRHCRPCNKERGKETYRRRREANS